MEDRIFIILDECKKMYCYIVLNSILEDVEINEIVKRLYYSVLEEDKDFGDNFANELTQIKDIKVKSIIYKDMKILCV